MFVVHCLAAWILVELQSSQPEDFLLCICSWSPLNPMKNAILDRSILIE